MTGDIVISNGDQIAQALQPVLDKLAITGSQFWEIYVAYIQMGAILSIATSLLIIATTLVVLKIAWDYNKTSSDRGSMTIGAGIAYVVVAGLLYIWLSDSILRYLCPEYFAIQNIISQVGGLV